MNRKRLEYRKVSGKIQMPKCLLIALINCYSQEQVGLFMYALKVVTSLGQQTELVKIQKLEKDTNGVSLVGVSCEVVCAC